MNLDDFLVQIQHDKRWLLSMLTSTDVLPSPELTDTIAFFQAKDSLTKQQKLEFVVAAFQELNTKVVQLQTENTKLRALTEDVLAEKKAITEQLRYSQYQDLFASVALRIRESWQIEDILQTAVSELQKILNCERVLFLQVEADGLGKVIKEAVVPGLPIMLGQVIEDEFLSTCALKKYCEQQIYIFPDISKTDFTPGYLEFLQQYQICSNLIVPVIRSEKTGDEIAESTNSTSREQGTGKGEGGKIVQGEEYLTRGYCDEAMGIKLPSTLASRLPVSRSSSPYLNSQFPFFKSQRPIKNPLAPSIIQNQFWGLLLIQHCKKPREWTPLQIDLLKQLSKQLSIALYQAHLLENEIIQRQKIAQSNAELEQFAYAVCHDLKAPLSTTSVYVQLLDQRYKYQLDDKGNSLIKRILSQTKRMNTLINELLDYSRLSRSQKPHVSIDCNQIVEEVMANLQIVIRKTKAVVTYTDLPVVVADRFQLIRLFQNLIDNGIKYCKKGSPLIHISAILEGDKWLFSVKDNGIGIDPKYSERIFQIFQRFHTDPEYSGTGIGLAICQKIVESYGGSIWVESKPGQGSTFYFTLPNP